jgi:hypothetical protein
MRPVTISVTGVATSSIAPLDRLISPFNIGLGAVVSGTVTYTIQHTFDDIYDSTVTPTWFPHATLVNLTANADGNYAFPVRAIRINNTAGTGTTTLTILQAGSGN